MVEHLLEFPEKVLVATFTTSAGWVGKYYKDRRMEIFFGDVLWDTFYSIEEYRAERVFQHHYGNKPGDD